MKPRRTVRTFLLRVAAAFAVVSAAQAAPLLVPDFHDVKEGYRASDVLVMDRNGLPLQRVRADYTGRRGDWLALPEISPALIEAVIQSEDRRFRDHNGVDPLALASAAWSFVWGGARRGASTLTMQLAGLIQEEYQRPADGRGIIQKLDQALFAQAIERRWDKAQILEAYLNLVPFRGELIGVDAVSRVMFQKHANGLDARESALIAVMLRGPNVAVERLVSRTCKLLKQLRDTTDCIGLDLFVKSKLKNRSRPLYDRDGLVPHFSRWIVDKLHPEAGQRVATSIDKILQQEVLRIVNSRLRELADAHVRDAAVVVLDNPTGEVLAYVGSSGALSDAPWVDHAIAHRQAGSTLKPFLYQQAIEEQRITAVSLLEDSPLNLPTGNGLYIPRNYDEGYSGWVSARTALASSLNIPAVRVLTMVGPDAFRNRLVDLGLPLTRAGDYYGYSLALGSADVTLVSLTNAYRSLANTGLYSPVGLFPGIALPVRRVMDEGAAWIVGHMLSDPNARVRTFGVDSQLVTPFWTAVKTGTSKDMRDNWTVGWSEQYTVGVWAGNSAGQSMRDVSGVTGAGPIWQDVMNYLHRRSGSRAPQVPGTVRAGTVKFDNDLEPVRTDFFLGDTGVSNVTIAPDVGVTDSDSITVVAPVDGVILALDPDIPPANQKLVFRASVSGGDQALSWRIGREVLHGDEVYWLPRPGKHRVQLLGRGEVVLDTIRVEVRGAAEASPEHDES
ncbi:MAG TPA: penicillin-binding protein 1C [Pusillimonas sp.]|uniref:penicillin-binding protein 1C n=1 Tax=unclassified Pusillimonas TaxID=2640016 RepID=UPI00260D837A|nr:MULTISPECIES: penicillin-binding protein 1C [unclassified Pusillimonas]HLU19437.1 penicillin-binding protein 1C [Pusillimonas sp.]